MLRSNSSPLSFLIKMSIVVCAITSSQGLHRRTTVNAAEPPAKDERRVSNDENQSTGESIVRKSSRSGDDKRIRTANPRLVDSRFVVLRTGPEIEQLIERVRNGPPGFRAEDIESAKMEGGFIAPGDSEGLDDRLPYAIFVRSEKGPTNRLDVGICLTERRLLSISHIQLRQFDETIYDGKISVHEFGPFLKFITIELKKKTYTDLESLVDALGNKERDAIEFQKRHSLPSLKELKRILEYSEDRHPLAEKELVVNEMKVKSRFLHIGTIWGLLK